MLITRTSLLSGKTRSKEIDVDPEVLARWERGEGLAQNMFPHLNPSEREFIMTGITDDEWETLTNEEE
jgi:hypothetical protein